MSKKSKTTTNQTTVQTPTNPDWVTSPVQDVAGKISDLGKIDPYSLIAGADPLQSQAATAASQLGSDRSWYDKIMGAQPQQVQSQSLLDGLQNYMSPYTQNVVDSTLADFDANAGKTRAQQTLDMAGSGAFGGSGSAITRSMTEDNLARARTSAEASLRDQAFNTGATLSGQDATRRQDASSQNANLFQQLLGLQAQTGLGAEDSDRSNIALQSDIGQQLRAIEQARLGAPVSLAATQAGLLQSLPLNLFTGQTSTMNGTQTTKSSDPMGTIAGLGMAALAPFTGGASLAGLGGLFAGGAGAAQIAKNMAAASAAGGYA